MVRRRERKFGRWLGLLGVVALVGVGGWLVRTVLLAQEERESEAENLGPPPPLSGFPLKGGLRSTAEQLDEPYQLAIDARFARARTLLAPPEGEDPKPWTLTFDVGHDFDPKVPFPEPPGFQDALSTVSGHVAAYQMHKPLAIDPGTWLLDPAQALAIIAQQTSAGPEPEEPLVAARAAVSLAFHAPDGMLKDSLLGGLALSWLARAEQELQADLVGDKALLARALGYTEESREFARQLPSGLLPSYLRFDDDALRAPSADPQKPFLWWRRQVELGSAEREWAFRAMPPSQRLGLSILGPLLTAARDHGSDLAVKRCRLLVELGAAELAGAQVEALRSDVASSRTPAEEAAKVASARRALLAEVASERGLELDGLGFLGRMERWLQFLERSAGSELAKELTSAYVEELALSCLSTQLPEPIAQRADAEGRGASDSGDAGSVTAAIAEEADADPFSGATRASFSQLKQWAELRRRAEDLRTKQGEVIAAAEDLTALGGRAHLALYSDLVRAREPKREQFVPLIQYLLRHLDTRPRALRWAAEALTEAGIDRRYEEYLFRSWSRSAASAEPRLADFWKVFSTRREQDVGDSPMSLHEFQLRSALEPTTNDWLARRKLTRFLRRQDRSEEIPPVVDPWLRSFPTESGPALQWALSSLARVELSRGDVKKAVQLLGPVSEGTELGTLVAKAKIGLASDDLESARMAAQQALRQYPDDFEARLLGLELFWARVPAVDVDAIVLAIAREQDPALWEDVSQAFVAAHRTRPAEEAKLAYQATFRSVFDPGLLERFGEALLAHELFEHCVTVLELSERLSSGGARFDLLRYRCRRETSGRELARRVLADEMKAIKATERASLIYEFGPVELLWETALLDLPETSDELWALRAASLVRQQKGMDPRVDAYFRKTTGAEGYAGVGRSLTGHLEEAELIAKATDDSSTSRVTYYLGLLAEAQGNIAEAIVWYRACVQANTGSLMEHRLARRRLTQIHERPLPLEGLGQ